MKFVLDIDTDNPYTDKNGNKVYVATSGAIYEHVVLKGLEPLTTEYINEHFGEKFAYRTEIAKGDGMALMYNAIMQMIDMNSADRMDAFGMVNTYDIITNLSPSAFYTKLTAYEETKKAEAEIKVGDEVEAFSGRAIVFEKFTEDGEERCYYWYPDEKRFDRDRVIALRKTGRHFPEVVELLKKVKGGEE